MNQQEKRLPHYVKWMEKEKVASKYIVTLRIYAE